MIKKIIIIIFIVCIAVGLYSCHNCSINELWREKVELPDGSHIMLYHSNTCSKKRPFFAKTEQKISFRQLKYDVFDYCLDEHEIRMLIAISNQNIQEYEEGPMYTDDVDWEYHTAFMSVTDTTYRPYRCYYSLKDDKLIQLTTSYRP